MKNIYIKKVDENKGTANEIKNIACQNSGNNILKSVLLFSIIIIAYFPIFNAGFVWDDFPAIHENIFLKTLRGLFKIWTTHGMIPNESHYWPMVYTSYWLEYRIWDETAFGYHLTNLILHIINSFLLWILLKKMKIPGSWFAATIFGIQPMHVESVAWIIERKDVLSGFFYLFSFLFYLYYDENRKHFMYIISIVIFIFALLSKSIAITLPFSILLWLWWKKCKVERSVSQSCEKLKIADIIPLIPYFAVAFIYGIIDVRLARQVESVNFGFNIFERILIAGKAFWFYIYKLSIPINLLTIYPRWQIDAHSLSQYMFPAGALSLFIVLFAFAKKIGKGPLFCLIYFAGTISPTLGFFDFVYMEHSFVADRFVYLASIGPIILFSAFAGLCFLSYKDASKRSKIFYLPFALLAAVLVIFCFLTFRQARLYKDIKTLFEYNLKKNPNSHLIHTNLAFALMKEGNIKEAKRHLEEALSLNSNNAEAHNNMGVILAREGDIKGAVMHYRAAMNAGAKWIKMLNDLAWFLATSDDDSIRNADEAIKLAEQVNNQTGFNDPAILDTLAAAYAEKGKFDAATHIAQKAINLASKSGQESLEKEIRSRLNLYIDKKPFREKNSKKLTFIIKPYIYEVTTVIFIYI